MKPNPVLKKLGLADNDRVVVVHMDDIGMCQASVDAFSDLTGPGVITCGSVMVPCSWASSAAAFARQNPKADLGVHITLTSEWDAYRWRPISNTDPSTGMVDGEGFFHRTVAPVQENANPQAVAVEMEAQILWAIENGINPSHLDTHMGTVAHPKFLKTYLELAVKYKLAPMMLRLDSTRVKGILDVRGIDDNLIDSMVTSVNQLEVMGIPLLDNLVGMPLDSDPAHRIDQVKGLLKELPTGVTHFLMHPSKDTPELRAIAPDWACRVADYVTFMKTELQDFMKQEGLHPFGYRQLQELIP